MLMHFLLEVNSINVLPTSLNTRPQHNKLRTKSLMSNLKDGTLVHAGNIVKQRLSLLEFLVEILFFFWSPYKIHTRNKNFCTRDITYVVQRPSRRSRLE